MLFYYPRVSDIGCIELIKKIRSSTNFFNEKDLKGWTAIPYNANS